MSVQAALVLGISIIVASALLCLAKSSPCAQASGTREGSYRMIVLDPETRFMVETSTGRVFRWGGNGGTWIEERRLLPWASD